MKDLTESKHTALGKPCDAKGQAISMYKLAWLHDTSDALLIHISSGASSHKYVFLPAWEFTQPRIKECNIILKEKGEDFWRGNLILSI